MGQICGARPFEKIDQLTPTTTKNYQLSGEKTLLKRNEEKALLVHGVFPSSFRLLLLLHPRRQHTTPNNTAIKREKLLFAPTESIINVKSVPRNHTSPF